MANFSSIKTMQNERVRAYNNEKKLKSIHQKLRSKSFRVKASRMQTEFAWEEQKQMLCSTYFIDDDDDEKKHKQNHQKQRWLLTSKFAHATLPPIARRRDTPKLIKKNMKSQQEPVVCVRHITKKKPRKLIDWFLLKCFVILFCQWQYILFYSSLRFTRFPASFSLTVSRAPSTPFNVIGLWAQHAALFSAVSLLHWMESSDNLIVASFVCVHKTKYYWLAIACKVYFK